MSDINYEAACMTNWRVVGPDEPYGDIEIHDQGGRFCWLLQDDAPVRDFNEMQWRRAYLMNAAPAMLAALKAMRTAALNNNRGLVAALELTDAAIAEAEGGVR